MLDHAVGREEVLEVDPDVSLAVALFSLREVERQVENVEVARKGRRNVRKAGCRAADGIDTKARGRDLRLG